MSKSEVARELGVTRQTVAAWEQRLAEGGKESLKRGELGRPRQLDAEQERELGKVLKAGALAWPAQFARNWLKSMQRRPTLITAFWKQGELAF